VSLPPLWSYPALDPAPLVAYDRTMLDLPRMQRIRLSPRPRVQRALGAAFLTPNYRLPPRVRIEVEGRDNLPDEPVIYAMNHTDRYNYWPFQYWLWRELDRYTATWVKGKYYESRLVGRFMELTNNIPAPSRGYILARDFTSTVGRKPTADEYRALRQLCDGEDAPSGAVPHEVLTAPRSMLGRPFDPAQERYPEAVARLLAAMNARFVELNAECFDHGLDLLIFPQGTRSIRLTRGHVGIAQAALRFRRPVVPVGCSGSDRVYPGGSPWGRRGAITYRIGAPITVAQLERHALPDGVDPFGAEADPGHRAALQSLVDEVMARINDLVDPEYQFAAEDEQGGARGAERFL
jgi:1-acyl-sn-glycerol-3-phosphate acyltransferase